MMTPFRRLLVRPAVLAATEPATPDFVPPLQRRRLSRLQQRFFVLAHRITAGLEPDFRVVFASRDGEDTLTRNLVEAFNAEGDVSPMRFSTSVYNAAPGLYSIFTKNPASYSAIAAGDATAACSLLEALLSPHRTLWIWCEEAADEPAFGVLIEPEHAGEEAIPCQVAAGSPDAPLLSADALEAFFAGASEALVTPYFTLTRTANP